MKNRYFYSNPCIKSPRTKRRQGHTKTTTDIQPQSKSNYKTVTKNAQTLFSNLNEQKVLCLVQLNVKQKEQLTHSSYDVIQRQTDKNVTIYRHVNMYLQDLLILLPSSTLETALKYTGKLTDFLSSKKSNYQFTPNT